MVAPGGQTEKSFYLRARSQFLAGQNLLFDVVNASFVWQCNVAAISPGLIVNIEQSLVSTKFVGKMHFTFNLPLTNLGGSEPCINYIYIIYRASGHICHINKNRPVASVFHHVCCIHPFIPPRLHFLLLSTTMGPFRCAATGRVPVRPIVHNGISALPPPPPPPPLPWPTGLWKAPQLTPTSPQLHSPHLHRMLLTGWLCASCGTHTHTHTSGVFCCLANTKLVVKEWKKLAPVQWCLLTRSRDTDLLYKGESVKTRNR